MISRGLLRIQDLKWVFLACIIPDLPWMVKRVLSVTGPDFSPYDLKLYIIVQGSLWGSLLLCGFLAVFSIRPIQAFLILSVNCLIHLSLDALQTKWGNGVHLLAPFSWEMLNFNLFWPDSVLSVALTLSGLAFYAVAWLRLPPDAGDLALPGARRAAVGICCLAAYLLAPLVMLDGPEAADNHYIRTLRQSDSRIGKFVEFDRVGFELRKGQGILRTSEGDAFRVLPDGRAPGSGRVSVRATFTASDTLKLHAIRYHRPLFRDVSSYVGFVLIVAFWARALVTRNRTGGQPPG